MIVHLVLFTLHPGLTADDPDVRAAAETTRGLAAEIPALRAWRFGRNIAERSTACDFAGIGLLDDETALAAYLADPFHQSLSQMWSRISDRTTADLRVPALERPGSGELPYDLDLIKGD